MTKRDRDGLLPNGAAPLQAKADPSCPICQVWVAFQHDTKAANERELLRAGNYQPHEAHTFVVAGYWQALNRPGECCTVHKGQLEALDRMFHATRESQLIMPGDRS